MEPPSPHRFFHLELQRILFQSNALSFLKGVPRVTALHMQSKVVGHVLTASKPADWRLHFSFVLVAAF